jgi:hypothetical protein
MKILLREPLFHFLLLGCVFFLLYQLLVDGGEGEAAGRMQIRISEARIEAIAAGFEKTWQRPPSVAEMDSLLQGFVREEIYYREALALGLDQDDPVLRQRLAQKLRFLLEDLTQLAEPTEAELQAYLDANPDAYRRSPSFSLRMVYLNPELRGADIDVEAEAGKLLTRLRAGDVTAADTGDTTMLPRRYENESLPNIGRDMGRDFVQQLVDVPVGSWQGPLVSSFGLHLVYIEERIDSKLPVLDEVRKPVLRDWTSEQRRQANEANYQELHKRYQVIIEEPLSGVSTSGLTMPRVKA